MSQDELLKDLLGEFQVTSEDIQQYSEGKRKEIYSTISHQLNIRRRQSELDIKQKYDKLQKEELKRLLEKYEGTKQNLISFMDICVPIIKKEVPLEIKQEAWQRKFGHKFKELCPVCNSVTISKDNYETSHLIAESRGGSNTVGNILPTCSHCVKSDRNLVNIFITPMDSNQILEQLIKPYFFFRFHKDSQIELNVCEENMYIRQTEMNQLNTDVGNVLDLDVCLKGKIILNEVNLPMQKQTGNLTDKCYYVNVKLLWNYIHLVLPKLT